MTDLGVLITFEGIDGSGKTTQARLFHQHLRARKVNCALYREPGGTPFGESVRRLLLNEGGREGKGQDFGPMAETMLFLAARAELMRQIVLPLLTKGSVVILDRFTDSTLAYQGYGRGLDVELLKRMNDAVTGGRSPDLTILVDLDPETALARHRRSHDRMELEGLEFMRRVREGYLAIAEAESERVMVLDGSRKETEIAADVNERVNKVKRISPLS